MIIRDLSEGTLTVSIDANECEQLATYLALAASCGGRDPDIAETLSGFFLASALACKTHGLVNLDDKVQEALAAVIRRVRREVEGEEADAAD